MYGTIFPTSAKCRSHAWFSRVQTYTYVPRYVVIVRSVFSLNVIAVVVSLVKNYTLTSKHRDIIVITTTKQYFSLSPEKILLSINFFAHNQ